MNINKEAEVESLLSGGLVNMFKGRTHHCVRAGFGIQKVGDDEFVITVFGGPTALETDLQSSPFVDDCEDVRILAANLAGWLELFAEEFWAKSA